MRAIALSMLASIPLAGCVTGYSGPSGREGAASIEFKASDLSRYSVFQPGWHEFTSVTDPDCTEGPGDGRLAFLRTGKLEQIASVRADRLIFVRAVFTRHLIAPDGAPPGPPGTITTAKDSCISIVSFVPEADHRYALRQESAPKCTVELVDIGSGSEPTNLKRHMPGKACNLYKNYPYRQVDR